MSGVEVEPKVKKSASKKKPTKKDETLTESVKAERPKKYKKKAVPPPASLADAVENDKENATTPLLETELKPKKITKKPSKKRAVQKQEKEHECSICYKVVDLSSSYLKFKECNHYVHKRCFILLRRDTCPECEIKVSVDNSIKEQMELVSFIKSSEGNTESVPPSAVSVKSSHASLPTVKQSKITGIQELVSYPGDEIIKTKNLSLDESEKAIPSGISFQTMDKGLRMASNASVPLNKNSSLQTMDKGLRMTSKTSQTTGSGRMMFSP